MMTWPSFAVLRCTSAAQQTPEKSIMIRLVSNKRIDNPIGFLIIAFMETRNLPVNGQYFARWPA
jgi:hypothetical protein